MRYGSLFSGYGGLDCGVQAVLGGDTAWHSEIDPGAARILDYHWPDVPNHGDITQVRWADVEPVDILTGGFPCQDVSHAGKRIGLRPGTRSGLWSHMAYAIDQLRPRLVVAENVRGLLSAGAGGDLEPCPWCVGDDPGGALRALGAVLGDLADLGYDADWYGVRASDAGAPHGRFRVFVFAWPADTESVGRERLRDARNWRPGPANSSRGSAAHADDSADDRQRARTRPAQRARDVADATRERRDEGWTAPARLLGRPDAAQRGDAPAADACGERHGRGQDGRALGRVDGRVAGEARERERAREVAGHRGAAAAADTDRDGREGVGRIDTLGRDADGCGRADTWGDYEPAVRRWEQLTRPAPAPTQPTTKGSQRLSPLFVEWLMGLPAGHVTDLAIGLTRNQQLKALGNGVVPQQAALATRLWLDSGAASEERAA